MKLKQKVLKFQDEERIKEEHFMASYKKLKSGWQYRVSYVDEEGVYRTKSKNGFRTKGEAQIEADKVQELLEKGHDRSADMTFGDYMQSWFETYKKNKSTVGNEIEIQRSVNWVKKYFKNMKLKDITRQQYQRFLNWYGDGRTTETVKKVHIYAKSCLQDAKEEGHTLHNPTYRVIPMGTVASKKAEDKYLGYYDTQKIIKEIKRDIQPDWHSRYMLLIAISSGLRFSEILALNWGDIDFKQQTINVNKSFDYRETQSFKPPKTESSYRTVPIDKETIMILKSFKLGNDNKYGDNLFIEDTYEGYEYISNNAVNKSLERACQRAGVKRITFHGLRHTHCSLLIYSGRPIKYISSRLGHSSVAVTYEVYGHIIRELEEQEDGETVAFIGELMEG